MDFNKIVIFGAMKKRFAWLSQRQEVLAENVANSDTPKYRPRDVKAFDFKKAVVREVRRIDMEATQASHLPGQVRRVSEFRDEEARKPYETAPAGNAVILEEQMMKINETGLNHRLTAELYRKHLGMFRTAIGRGR